MITTCWHLSKDTFPPLKFLDTLRCLYSLVVTDGVGQMDLPLDSHLKLSDSIPHQWIDERDGRHFLRLHCLQGEKPPLDDFRPGSDIPTDATSSL